MSNLMTGMFWGGLVMAVPAVLVSVAAIVLIRKQDREAAEAGGEQPKD